MLVRPRPARSLVSLAALLAACSSGAGRTASPPPVAVPYGAPELVWARGGCAASWCQTGWYASPAVADLDGDGAPEVVWAASDVVALRAEDGSLAWRAAGGGRVWASPVVADLDGDGAPEVAAGRHDGTLTVYGAGGEVRWTRTPFGAGLEVRALAAADLDGDGALELVAGRGSPGDTRQVSAYAADGALLPGFPARRDGEPGYGWGMYNQNAAIADLDGDGAKEIIAPTDTHYVTALDGAGNQLAASAVYGAGKVWSQVGVHVDEVADLRGHASCGTEHRPNFAHSAPAIGDLDGDGAPEIVIVGNVYDCGGSSYRSLYAMPFVLRADRTRWKAGPFDWTVLPAPGPGSAPRSEDDATIWPALPNAVLADLDGDGRREILYPAYDGKVHAYGLDRKEPGSWPFAIPGGGIRFASEPAVADLDGDGKAEVIVATWPEVASGGTGRLLVLDAQGRLAHDVALPDAPGAFNGGPGAPAVARLAPGGDAWIFVGTAHAGLAAYRVPRTAAARVLWGTGRGNLLRDGTPPP